MKIYLISVLLTSTSLAYGQNCSGCTINVNGTSTLNVNLYPGNVLCVNSGSEILGDIINYGGVVCNEGIISGDYIQYSGTLNNYNLLSASSDCIINEGVVNNYEEIQSTVMAVHGADVVINNHGMLSPDEYDMNGDSLSQTSVLHNHGTLFVTNFHADTSMIYNYGSFYTAESIHINPGAYFYGYGPVVADLDYYNNGYSELYCMASVGGDLFNNGESAGPPFGCGGYTVAGSAFNNGNFGTNGLPLDLCKTTGPGGFNGSLGTIGSNVSYCVCSASCTPQTAGIESTPASEKTLLKVVDLTGREVEVHPNTLLIYIYSDGSAEKVFRME